MRAPIQILWVMLLFSAFIISCGGGGNDQPQGEAQEMQAETEAAAPAGSAKISGTINFQGTAPERRPVRQDRECQVLHEEPVYSQEVVVNENGTLRYVFIYVKEGLENYSFNAPQEPVVLDQKGCMYEPHVFGMQTGQSIKILNSDPLLHNIHALPQKNRPFNFGMPNKGDVRERTFQVPEVMVPIKCDVHPWMSAYAGVVTHPYYDVSDESGTFSVENLPAGEYVIEAWHEKYGTQTQTISVTDDESKTADFTFGNAAS